MFAGEIMDKQSVSFDVLIAGAGISGLTTAIALQQKGIKCLIFEKKEYIYEKVCGGGVYYKALDLLQSLNIPIYEFIAQHADTIVGVQTITSDGSYVKKLLPSGAVSAGVLRKDFDTFLLKQAIHYGTQVKFQTPASMPNIDEYGQYRLAGYAGKKFVSAIGARGFSNSITQLAQQSFAISAILSNNLTLDRSNFYYWITNEDNDEYFWSFPVGKTKWNIGYYERYYHRYNIAEKFSSALSKYISPHLKEPLQYFMQPRCAFLGTRDWRSEYLCDGLGDFAGLTNPVNGGGILPAIRSALEYAQRYEKEYLTC